MIHKWQEQENKDDKRDKNLKYNSGLSWETLVIWVCVELNNMLSDTISNPGVGALTHQKYPFCCWYTKMYFYFQVVFHRSSKIKKLLLGTSWMLRKQYFCKEEKEILSLMLTMKLCTDLWQTENSAKALKITRPDVCMCPPKGFLKVWLSHLNSTKLV